MNVTATGAGYREVNWFAFVLRSVLLPILLTVVAVVSPLPINFAAFMLWLALLASFVRKQLRQQRRALSITSVLTQVTLMVMVVTAARLALGKTTDRFLDRAITLPKSRMTLGELAGDLDGPRPEWCSSFVSIYVPNHEKARVIEFPGTSLTLRQFVDAIETQCSLRHRFAHCGNGSTILWGGDCSFGLYLSTREAAY